jgi:hypothetical protein
MTARTAAFCRPVNPREEFPASSPRPFVTPSANDAGGMNRRQRFEKQKQQSKMKGKT